MKGEITFPQLNDPKSKKGKQNRKQVRPLINTALPENEQFYVSSYKKTNSTWDNVTLVLFVCFSYQQ